MIRVLLLLLAALCGGQLVQATASPDTSHDRNLKMGQGVYMNTFSQTVTNLVKSLSPVPTSKQSTDLTKGIQIMDGEISIIKDISLISNGISTVLALLAAVGAGLGAMIAFIIPPLQIGNQILAIIAIAMLFTYVVEDHQYMPFEFLDTYYEVDYIHKPEDDKYASTNGYNSYSDKPKIPDYSQSSQTAQYRKDFITPSPIHNYNSGSFSGSSSVTRDFQPVYPHTQQSAGHSNRHLNTHDVSNNNFDDNYKIPSIKKARSLFSKSALQGFVRNYETNLTLVP